jgi:hypothetical protein
MAIFVSKPSFNQEWDSEKYLQKPDVKLIETMEMEMLDLINGFRAREGINPVSISPGASAV